MDSAASSEAAMSGEASASLSAAAPVLLSPSQVRLGKGRAAWRRAKGLATDNDCADPFFEAVASTILLAQQNPAGAAPRDLPLLYAKENFILRKDPKLPQVSRNFVAVGNLGVRRTWRALLHLTP